MRLMCEAFERNKMIPKKYTADGEDVNPPLIIEDIPNKAETLVLIVDDPDAPNGDWVHWVVYDMPLTNEIAEDSVPGTQGINDFRKLDYGGPAPPSGVHRYFFKVYALDTALNLPESRNKREILAAIEGHVLDKAELVGKYGR